MTDWYSGIAMLLSGLVLGFMFVYSMKRKAPPSDVKRRDLQAKLDALVQQLRELDDAGDGVEEERERLEREAAAALRALEGAGPSPTDVATEAARQPVAVAQKGAQLKGFLWGAVSVGILAGLGWFVTQSSKPRSENEPVTGGATASPMATGRNPQGDDLAQLEEAVRAHPDNLSLRDDLARAYLERQNLLAAGEQTQYVLGKSPNDARALTYQAVVRMAMGQTESAVAMLQKATKSDPSLLDGWVYLALVYTQSNRPDEAQQAISEAMKQHPEERERLQEVFNRMKSGPMQQQTSEPEPAPAPAAASGPSVHITLNVTGNVPPQGVIFVLARAAGVTSGPPAAVKRLAVGGFPMSVDLGAADSMMGQPLPDKLRIEARIDSDGNAMTKEPTDMSAVEDNVAVGSTVNLTLK